MREWQEQEAKETHIVISLQNWNKGELKLAPDGHNEIPQVDFHVHILLLVSQAEIV